MRTYEDVKEALKKYEDELKRESNIKRDHFIIMGGNVNVVRKGIGDYALEKGTPVPMIWETAKKKHAEFQEKCGDNIRLEIIKYSDWLIKNIEECKKLIKCMRKQFSSNVDPHESAPESVAENTESAPESVAENTESVPESTAETTESVTEDTESIPESTAENPESVPESTAENPESEPENTDQPQSPAGPSHTARQLDDVSCPSCPYGIKTCMVCKFASGINMNVFPWEIICSVPNRTVKNKSQKSC